MQSPQYILDGDAEWLAVDSVGHIGFFTTAGYPVAPRCYFDDGELGPAVSKWLSNRRPIGSHRLAIEKESGSRLTSWRDAADHGMFAYDIEVVGQQFYFLAAIPDRPLLRSEITDLNVALPRFAGVFGETEMQITADAIMNWFV